MTDTQRSSGARNAAIALSIALAAAACGSEDPVDATDMWALPTAADADTAAFYGTLTNTTDQTVSFEDGYSRGCESIELHRSTSNDGVMSMAPADLADLQIAPGDSMVLEPNGLHVMCVGLVEPLVEGTPVNLEFTFDETGAFVTDVAIEQR